MIEFPAPMVTQQSQLYPRRGYKEFEDPELARAVIRLYFSTLKFPSWSQAAKLLGVDYSSIWRWREGGIRSDSPALRRLFRLLVWDDEGWPVSAFAAVHWDDMDVEFVEGVEHKGYNPFFLLAPFRDNPGGYPYPFGTKKESGSSLVRDLDKRGVQIPAHLIRLLGMPPRSNSSFDRRKKWMHGASPGPKYMLRMLALALWARSREFPSLDQLWAVDWTAHTVEVAYEARTWIGTCQGPQNPFARMGLEEQAGDVLSVGPRVRGPRLRRKQRRRKRRRPRPRVRSLPSMQREIRTDRIEPGSSSLPTVNVKKVRARLTFNKPPEQPVSSEEPITPERRAALIERIRAERREREEASRAEQEQAEQARQAERAELQRLEKQSRERLRNQSGPPRRRLVLRSPPDVFASSFERDAYFRDNIAELAEFRDNDLLATIIRSGGLDVWETYEGGGVSYSYRPNGWRKRATLGARRVTPGIG